MNDLPETAAAAFERAEREGRVVTFEYDGLALARTDDDVGPIPRGTVRSAAGILPGYPHIGRILVLRKGLRQQLDGPFHVEEKINGYNVRIARVGDRLLAFSRGGFVCPFTTDRLPDLLDPAFFEAHPDGVLCAEVAGPENPWLDASPPFVKEDVQLFVFDIGRWNSADYLPCEEKYRVLDEFGLPGVPTWGYHTADDYPELAQRILKLNAEGREGLIFRQETPRRRQVKYVTASINLEEIRRSAARMPDMPPGYFAGRILRIALFLREHNLPASALEPALGESLLGALDGSLAELLARHKVSHPFRCRFRQKANAERMIETLQRAARHQVKIIIHDLVPEGDYWRLTFERRYPKTNSLLDQLLGGGMIYD